jgi:hypothetical protein
MDMSNPTPNAPAMRRVFFSIRMHVAPHPASHEAYSARNDAILRMSVCACTQPAVSIVEVIIVAVSGDIEHFSFFAEFKQVSRLAHGVVVPASGMMLLYGS